MKKLIPFFLAVLIAGCTQKTPEVTQYTIEQFMNNIGMGGGYFSPDESKVIVHSDKSGIFNIYTIPLSGGEMTQLTSSDSSSIFTRGFFPEDERFIFVTDNNGDEKYHVYAYLEDGEVKDLTPWEGKRSVFYGWLYDEESFLAGSNKRDENIMDIYEVDKESLTTNMFYQNDQNLDFGGISRNEKFMAFTKSITTDNNEMYLFDRESGEMKHISEHEGTALFKPSGFSHDNSKLFYLTNLDDEFMYLMSYDIATGEREKLVSYDWDIMYSYLSHNGTYRVTGINEDARTVIKIQNTVTGEEVALPDTLEGDISGVTIADSEELMSFWLGSSKTPNDLYVYNFNTGDVTLLASRLNPEIDKEDLVDGEVIRFESFDGVEIPSILYKPKQATANNPVPALVWVHGGPGGQSRLTYFPLIQYLVNHGYTILAVNNRGSSGYGKTFYAMDNQRHGEGDLQDQVMAKQYLAEMDYIDSTKIGIIGGSYGGFMVMAALTKEPEEFDVGVNIFGVTNWLRTLRSIPPWWDSYRDALYAEMGDPYSQDSVRLHQISPLFHADEITKPFMVLQGAQDPRVLQVESDEIVEAAKANGVEVEYVLFEDEGHGFLKKENQIEGYRKIRLFLDEYLKQEEVTAETDTDTIGG